MALSMPQTKKARSQLTARLCVGTEPLKIQSERYIPDRFFDALNIPGSVYPYEVAQQSAAQAGAIAHRQAATFKAANVQRDRRLRTCNWPIPGSIRGIGQP